MKIAVSPHCLAHTAGALRTMGAGNLASHRGAGEKWGGCHPFRNGRFQDTR